MTKISTASFTVFDVETTGVDPETDFVIEIGLAHFTDGQFSGRTGEIVNPWPGDRDARLLYISEEIEQITAITQDMVNEARDIGYVLDDLRTLTEGPFNVAYNAPFDRDFFRHTLRRHSRDLLAAEIWQTFTIDPLVWIRQKDKYLKGKGKYKLTSACERYGVVLDNAHRAYADAEATGKLLLALVAQKVIPDDLEKVMALQEDMRDAQDRDYQAYIAKMKAKDGQ